MQRVPLLPIVELHHELNGTGRYRSSKSHDSFVVDSQENVYYWNSKGESGDAYDYVGRYILSYGNAWDCRNSDMFKEALLNLSDMTGQPLSNFKPEPPEKRAKRLATEELLHLVADIFISSLMEPSTPQAKAAAEYAVGRGLHLESGLVGYAEGNLLKALPKESHTLALELGLLYKVENRLVESIGRGYLIYIHRNKANKPVFFAGRWPSHAPKAELKQGKIIPHCNQRGEKQPFIALNKSKGYLIIVEGQADAISLWQSGFNAIATCGTNLRSVDVDWLSLFDLAFLVDADNAGRGQIQKHGPAFPLAKIFSVDGLLSNLSTKSPIKDANEGLALGLSIEVLADALNQAPDFLSSFIISIKKAVNSDNLKILFDMVAKLDSYQQAIFRQKICDTLNIRKPDYDHFLGLSEEKKLYFPKGEQYEVLDGWMVFKNDGQPVPLVDADLKIAQIITHDDGITTWSEYNIQGKRGQDTLTADVPTGEFESLKWIYDKLPHLTIAPGRSTKDHLRAAIQYRSAGYIHHRTVYEHLGWRMQPNGKPMYMTTTGGIGSDNPVEVDLRMGQADSNMMRFAIPLAPTNLTQAIRASLNFWRIHDNRVTIPQWAACMLAVLAPFTVPDFGLWVYGKSGSFKSVIAALVLAHYGQWHGRDGRLFLPANFNSTANFIMYTAFMTKDALLVIDDYAPGNTVREMKERNETASRLLRSLGNKAGRGRMRDGRSVQRDTPPRCLAMITAEDTPDGQSILARAFGVSVPTLPPKGSAHRATIEQRISQAQEVESQLYSHAMSGFIHWISNNWENLQVNIPRWVIHHQKAIQNGGHARLTDAYAKLMTAIDTFMVYAVDMGAITQAQADEMSLEAAAALQDVLHEHSGSIEALDPIVIFAEFLSEQLDAGEWVLEDVEGPEVYIERNQKKVGWQDEKYIYLLVKYVGEVISESSATSGIPFPVKRPSLYGRLKDKGLLIADTNGKSTQVPYIPIARQTKRVVVLKKSILEFAG